MDTTIEAQEVSRAVQNGTAVRVRYVGEPTLTRGEYGERVEFGYVVNGYIYVWDADFGWFCWGAAESALFVPIIPHTPEGVKHEYQQTATQDRNIQRHAPAGPVV